MDRNKRPALTSPWKIGFLVSLLLVTVSIGVGYALTRTFGIKWTWLQLAEGSWAFDQAAFVGEMAVPVGMVVVMSLLAYFVITGAVRKYRSYLDSGLDYKNLIRSIEKIGDLNEDRINSIKGYPELKKFLLKISNRLSQREKSLDQREASIITRDGELTSSDNLKADAGVLLGALNRGGAEGFARELALTTEEMKQVEQAIRRYVQPGSLNPDSGDGAPSMAGTDGEQMSALRSELTATAESFKATIYDISAEIVASQNGAREIELYLDRVKTACQRGAASAGQAPADAVALAGRLDQLTAALASLGEETRGIAINTALQAGAGEGGVSDLVKLADDVREIAARFNGIAAQYQEVGGQFKHVVQAQSAGVGDQSAGETFEAMSGKIRYWVERSVVLSDKLNSFDAQLRDATNAIQSRLGTDAAPVDSYQNVQDLDIADDQTGISGGSEEPDTGTDTGEFVRETATPVVSETDWSATADGSGQEVESEMFEEIGGKAEDNVADRAQQTPAAGAAPGMTGETEPAPAPVSPRADEAGVYDSSEAETAEPGPKEYVIDEEPPQVDVSLEIESHRHETQPVTRPQPVVQPETGPEPVPAAAADRQPARPVEDDPVINLYKLGAVDYEPGVHQHV